MCQCLPIGSKYLRLLLELEQTDSMKASRLRFGRR